MSKIVLFKNGNVKDSEYHTGEDEILSLQKSALKQPAESEPVEEKIPDPAPVIPIQIAQPPVSEGKSSFIEKGIVITGSVSSVTNIEIFGDINGNITCENDVFISGCITGNVSAKNVQITAGQVKGDINCKSAVQINRDSSVKGNILGESLECDGKIEGNSKIAGKAEITGNASVLGDICARKISIEEGVTFIGKLQVKADE